MALEKFLSGDNPSVLVITSPSCCNCHTIVDYLKENLVEFEEYCVKEVTPSLAELLKTVGTSAVPITLKKNEKGQMEWTTSTRGEEVLDFINT